MRGSPRVRRPHRARGRTLVSLALLAAACAGPASAPGPGAVVRDGAPGGSGSAPATDSLQEAAVARRVEIVRTGYGVPHVLAQDLEAMGFALGWLQSEDHGSVAAVNLVEARGEAALHRGLAALDDDVAARRSYRRAVETWHRLDPETRAVYRGFAAGVNHYIRHHPDDFPEWMRPDLRGVDAHAREVLGWSRGDAADFRETFEVDGSNAWAFGPDRTASGGTILLRNPHLSWSAGYYEAHVRVPGVIDFYGDFRIGSAFGIIGGFNDRLGWATTNNYPAYSQVYALERYEGSEDLYRLDGRAHPVEVRTVALPYRRDDGTVATQTRTLRTTPFGPVIREDEDHLYVLKDPRDGEYRRGQQFLRMMQARTLDQWLEAMRLRAHPSSNFTYADADGNVVHYYNARLPRLPHPSTGDSAYVARRSTDIWSELVPWEELPLWINPPGGYVQQANDTPDYTNLNVRVDRDTLPPNLPPERLRPRSQLSLLLAHADGPVDGAARLTLDDVVALKHSPRMLVAERTLDDLLRALESEPALAEPRRILAAWDRTAAVEARGAVLFASWFEAYEAALEATGDTASFYREPWTPDRPMETPRGLGRPDLAREAMGTALDTLAARGWPPDVAWGRVHRVIRGDVDVPVAGCPSELGCFRTLSFQGTGDGRRAANRGDGWVLLVEFGPDRPRARSVLAYGQSPREDSPHHADQAALFARGGMKTVAWTPEEIEAAAIRRYRPGGR